MLSSTPTSIKKSKKGKGKVEKAKDDGSCNDSDVEWVPSQSEDQQSDTSTKSKKNKKSSREEKKRKKTSRERMLKYRANMTPEEKDDYKRKARESMRKLREENKKKPKARLTDEEVFKKRAEWARYTREARARERNKDKTTRELKTVSKVLKKMSGPDLLKVLEDNLTPTKKQFLQSRGAYISPGSRKKVSGMKSLCEDIKQELKNHAKNDYQSV